MRTAAKHPCIDGDIEDAAGWYAARNTSVAIRFIDEVRDAIRAAAENPFHYQERFGDVRCVWLTHFPHGVFFVVMGSRVYILAVLHGARDVESVLPARKPVD